MPNWVENELRVAGKAEEMDRFRVQFRPAEGFSFNFLLLYPARYQLADDASKKRHNERWYRNFSRPLDGYNNGGIEWREEHWGTKWDAQRSSCRQKGNILIIEFETAWCPPLPFVHALMQSYPTLFISLEYFERGAAFCGGLWRAEYEAEEDEPREIHEWRCNDYGGPRGG